MKIAIGGLKKDQMSSAIKEFNPEIETVITTDMASIPMLQNKEVDYYFGACESGGGAAISILIGVIGYSNCGIACKNGESPSKEKIEKLVNEGKKVFGMAHDKISQTVPILLEILTRKTEKVEGK